MLRKKDLILGNINNTSTHPLKRTYALTESDIRQFKKALDTQSFFSLKKSKPLTAADFKAFQSALDEENTEMTSTITGAESEAETESESSQSFFSEIDPPSLFSSPSSLQLLKIEDKPLPGSPSPPPLNKEKSKNHECAFPFDIKNIKTRSSMR